MSQFIDVITGFPTVVFTVLLLSSVGYWIISSALGFESFDADVDTDSATEIDADVGADGPAGAGGGEGLVASLGLDLMPVSLVVTVIALVGWVVSAIASIVVGTDGRLGAAIGVVVLMAALAAGLMVSGRVARLVSPIFSPAPALRHADLLGRLCVVRTGRVDGAFGQAEVIDREGSSHLVQVRCPGANKLEAGDQALLVDLDDGVFVVTSEVDDVR